MRGLSKNLILGVDIGGTKVAAGLVDSSGKIVVASRVPMVARRGPDEGLRAVYRAIDEVLLDPRARRASAIGISVPGWVDFHRGSVIRAANLPCWRNFPLSRKIARHYAMPARIANDADAAALAEATWGAGAKSKNVFYVSLGTGIGTGLVEDRKIQLGRGGSAFEGGHTTINFQGPLCPCGKRGCIEMYASGTAIARLARERLSHHRARGSRMLSIVGGDRQLVTAETVNQAASAGDKLALKVLEEAADHLAIWLGNIIDLLEPHTIIFGGGLARTMISFLPRIRKHLDRWAINPRRRQVPIVRARYGSESALVGAAASCLLNR